MRKFILGFAVGIIAVLLGMFVYIRFGFADPRADIPVGAFEAKVAMPSLDAAVDKRAPEAHDPLQPTEDNLLAGMKIYQANCASCHGDIQHTEGSWQTRSTLARRSSFTMRQICLKTRTSTSSSTVFD
jgi:hypothetical protein